MHPCIHASMHPCTKPFIHSHIRSSIHSFTPSFIHPHLSIHSYFPCVAESVSQSVTIQCIHARACSEQRSHASPRPWLNAQPLLPCYANHDHWFSFIHSFYILDTYIHASTHSLTHSFIAPVPSSILANPLAPRTLLIASRSIALDTRLLHTPSLLIWIREIVSSNR